MTMPSPETVSGRELDASVARDLFGLEVQERTNARTGERDFVCREPGRDWNRVAFYGSLGASIKLELRLSDLGWMVKPSPLGRQPDASGVARAVLINGEREVEGMGTTFAEALSRAALRAMASTASGVGVRASSHAKA